MRRSIFLKTLGSFRTAILGWGLGMGFLMLIVTKAFDSAIGVMPATTKAQFVLAFQSVGWLWDYPGAVVSAGGYTTAKYGSFMALVAIWGLLAGTRITRGEEESGQLDMLLSLPRSRALVVAEKLGATFVALLLIGALIGLFAYAGVSSSKFPRFSLGDALMQGLMISLLAASFAGIGVFLSQFTRHRSAAAGITGALLALGFVLNSLSLVSSQLEWLGRLSPIYYFRISKPLVADYGMNWGAAAALAVITLVFAGAGAALFLRRDVGSTVAVAPASGRFAGLRLPAPQGGWSLSSFAARAVALELPATLWWAIALGLFYVIFTKITRTLQINLVDSFKGTIYESIFKSMAGGNNPSGNAFFLSLLLSYIPLVIAAMAVTQVSRWERAEAEGQLDLVLATPLTRATAILTRILAAVLGTAFVLAITFGATLLAVNVSGLELDTGRLAESTLGALPWGVVVLAVGYLLATWLRRGLLVTVLSFALAISYGIQVAAPAAGWPDGTQKLSIFWYFGSPILSGLDWHAVLGLSAIAVVCIALATWRFAVKDIGRWAFVINLWRRRRQRAAVA
ncbi:MAG TPA: ABC transporter permease subunit [Ktedonobacterales bacterium]|nr:ABC transporter permease subunit [Ktedonobacterales bacterium]